MINLKFRVFNNGVFEYFTLGDLIDSDRDPHSDIVDYDKSDQYTGIKDINGNEIYVGDIISRVYKNSWDTEDQFESPEAVEFSECDASIQGSVCDVPMLAFNLGGFPLTLDDKYKIVGNIYENKELINHQ